MFTAAYKNDTVTQTEDHEDYLQGNSRTPQPKAKADAPALNQLLLHVAARSRAPKLFMTEQANKHATALGALEKGLSNLEC